MLKTIHKYINQIKKTEMKKIITVLFVLTCLTGTAQTAVKQDAKGNYIAVRAAAKDTTLKATGKTYTDTKGKVYPVYISKNGKIFVNRLSAKGVHYRMYLKTQ